MTSTVSTSEKVGESSGARGQDVDRTTPLLSVRDLQVHFPLKRGFIVQREVARVKAVDGVSFDIYPGETLGLVGESGSGKTTAAKAVVQLNKPGNGSVKFEGQELVGLSTSAMRPVRRKMGMVFQDPYGSLNPRMRAGDIVGEPLKVHGLADTKEAYREQVASLMTTVGLSPAMAERYPNEFSGGQRQRLGVARAIAARPSLLILDESVSALDVSIQAQILNLLQDLQEKYNLAYLFIAHDLSVVRHISHRVAVMYLGKIVETADAKDLYERPLHPYTQALLSAIPTPNPVHERSRERIILRGDLPSPLAPPPGCSFSTRCPIATDICSQTVPELKTLAPNQQAACHLATSV
ncbi:ABC transporter ATP-binding protein [Candidatus Lucifugimonas marina]|uniref:ATP-binding cassette domain-containing protein n=1 Tax=Candidatus Lucifugimonas marina TaxID=3038979 RepID=A0AAJ5ZCE6_9CHLR|nr:ATP-binding cassette domain-containing protein [SAR202 cluster bacterium JH702]MDG0870863.1 ATP-binding cassette domain-containing protein [SAR202 cluster bacterium JH639]WFG34752.1 ATP-binding cassette domain-containing protein [SAR202 cluster bacterium JH545]WFG38679.1 ATP-binding cassette domain-containing protein [SAR202 cluster bacterium JH1073]